MKSTQLIIPSVNDCYDLGRNFGTVVISKSDAQMIEMKWKMKGNYPMTTKMPLMKFWEMAPVKTGSL